MCCFQLVHQFSIVKSRELTELFVLCGTVVASFNTVVQPQCHTVVATFNQKLKLNRQVFQVLSGLFVTFHTVFVFFITLFTVYKFSLFDRFFVANVVWLLVYLIIFLFCLLHLFVYCICFHLMISWQSVPGVSWSSWTDSVAGFPTGCTMQQLQINTNVKCETFQDSSIQHNKYLPALEIHFMK